MERGWVALLTAGGGTCWNELHQMNFRFAGEKDDIETQTMKRGLKGVGEIFSSGSR